MKYFFSFFALFTSPLFSQEDSWKIYDDTDLPRIDITVDVASLQWMYNNANSDSEHVAQFHFHNHLIDEMVDSVGFRLRGNTSRASQKKSFKISFNSFVAGRKFHDLEKMNLNGEHNDPSIIRSKLCFDLFADIGYPASRANHVRLYINGVYYGLYISVEHVDENFLKKNFDDAGGNLWKCLYPADLSYLGNTPAPYKALMNNATTPAYDLATNKNADDFSKFIKLVDVINNTPASAFPDSVEKYMSVYRVLQYFAMNTLLASWDDYRFLKNNYYLYHIPSENKFTIIPYDYDNTYGIDWFSIDWSSADPYTFPKIDNGVRPLSDKLMANNQYRDLFTHLLIFYSNNVYKLSLWESRIDRLKDTITAAAVEDTYRMLDYGFTVNDFNNSYSSSSYQNKHVKFGLKQFINARNIILDGQLNYKNAAPIAYVINCSPKNPSIADSIFVTASCFSHIGLKEVVILFSLDGSLSAQTIPMTYSPISNSKHVEDVDRWIGVIPPLLAGQSGQYKISLTDSLNQTEKYPRSEMLKIETPSSSASSVVINEFLADNTTIPDSNGQFDDWLELYNPTSSSITLTGKYLTDKSDNLTKWKFKKPDVVLAPGKFLLVWCDEDSGQAGIHTNFKLSAGGEFLALTDTDGVTILDSLSFDVQKTDSSFGRYPDGNTAWGFMLPTPLLPNSSVITTVRSLADFPNKFEASAFPNPFNPSTTIQYILPEMKDVFITIYDVAGREVWKMFAGRQQTGSHRVKWNGLDNAGGVVGTGMYVVRIAAGNYLTTLKVVLMK